MADTRVVPSDRAKRCAIAIMAKAPNAGRVKTRLLPVLRAEEATELCCCFLSDMTRMLAEAGRAAPIDGFIAFAPAGSEASFASIVAPSIGFVLADGSIDPPPGVEGFGCCLLQAARGLFDLGYGAIGLLNSDSPTMPAELMIEAARLLMQPDDRVVLGPATDGGYYLIGLRAPHAQLFTAIDWSTERAAAQTRERARACGLPVVELAPWYDVDGPESLEQLLQDVDGRPEAAPSSAEWLRRNGVAGRLAKARAM